MPLSNDDYKHKIVNASSTRLVIVTYELIADRIDKAGKSLKAGNAQDFRLNIDNAKQFVNELVCSLNMGAPVAAEMADLYFFVNKLLVQAQFKKEQKYLDGAAEIITGLKNGLMKEVDDGINLKGRPSVSDTYGKP